MKCAELTRDVLADAILGDEAPGVREHLAACGACRAELAALRPLVDGLRALGRAELPAPRRRYVTARRAWGPWAAAGTAAAAAILVIVLSLGEKVPAAAPPRVVVRPSDPPAPPKTQPPPAEPAPRREPVQPRPERREDGRSPAVAPIPGTREGGPPEPPTPKPADNPAPPSPAPRDTRAAVAMLSVAGLDGTIETEVEKRWQKVASNFAWREGASLRSTDRAARLTLEDGTRVALRPRTELRVSAVHPPSLLLEQGEVFCDVPKSPRQGAVKFQILTVDARVEVTGTQFMVRRPSGRTEVAVAAGEVIVANEKGETAVPAGTAMSVRAGGAPGKPRPADTDRLFAWRRELDPPETSRFRFDFEDGKRPAAWTDGKVVGAPRGLSRLALSGSVTAEGSSTLSMDLSRLSKPLAYRSNLRLRFRYRASGGTELTAQFFGDRARDNFRFDIKSISPGHWEAFDAPLSEFSRLADGSRLQEGDLLSWLNIVVWGATGPVDIDDVELVEVQKP